MSYLPQEIIVLLAPFAQLFSDRVWLHAQVLVLGAILSPDKRTVTAALRVMGLAQERRFTNYHRVLNRARWSALPASKILLGLIVMVLVPPGAAIVLGADDTLERRSGHIPVQLTAWYHKAEPTFSDCIALVRRHIWCARYLVNSAPKAEFVQFPREALDLWINDLPLAA